MNKKANKRQSIDMRLHIKKAYVIISEHLPEHYATTAQEKLKKKKYDCSLNDVRKTRNADPEKISEKYLPIIQTLVEIAKEHQAVKEGFKAAVAN